MATEASVVIVVVVAGMHPVGRARINRAFFFLIYAKSPVAIGGFWV
jgi:hypothetical protein